MRRFEIYSKENPSSQYHLLIDMYRQMHNKGYSRNTNGDIQNIKPESTFAGEQMLYFADNIRCLIRSYGSKSILDYGAGKGDQYKSDVNIPLEDGGTYKGRIDRFWEVERIMPFEPARGDVSDDEKFDAVVSTDVLEHIFAGDLPWVVREMFKRANHFVFANIACFHAAALLPNGDNAHITVRTPEWWRGLFDATASLYPDRDYLICCSLSPSRKIFFRRTDFAELSKDGMRFVVD